jgi:hypothetical protein
MISEILGEVSWVLKTGGPMAEDLTFSIRESLDEYVCPMCREFDRHIDYSNYNEEGDCNNPTNHLHYFMDTSEWLTYDELMEDVTNEYGRLTAHMLCSALRKVAQEHRIEW